MSEVLAVATTLGHLDLQGLLLTDDDRFGLIQQNAQLSVGMGRADMSHNHHPAPVFTRDLHRHRTRGGAHLPHVRHRPNLPV
mgnify:FL=1